MKKIMVEMELSDGNELSNFREERLNEGDDRARIKKTILDLYKDIEIEIEYQGSLQISGVSIDRAQNLNFQNYEHNSEELGVLKYEFNEREIPQEYKEMLKSESDLFREAMEDIDSNFKKDKSFNFKEFGDNFFKKYGYKYDDLDTKIDISDKSFLVNTFLNRFYTEHKKDYILLQEFKITSDLFLNIPKPDLDPLKTHIIRIERYIGEKDSGSNIKFVKPILTDFDNFMRGNPHLNSPKIL